MPIFEYKAVDTGNKTHRGIVDADSPREARHQAQGPNGCSSPTCAKTKSRKTRRLAVRGITGVDAPNKQRNEQIAAVTRQMASLLRAGIPLAETLCGW